jgi:hypothetical protein
MNNPIDYLKIIVIAWVSIWLINHGLEAAGLGQYAATASNASSTYNSTNG